MIIVGGGIVMEANDEKYVELMMQEYKEVKQEGLKRTEAFDKHTLYFQILFTIIIALITYVNTIKETMPSEGYVPLLLFGLLFPAYLYSNILVESYQLNIIRYRIETIEVSVNKMLGNRNALIWENKIMTKFQSISLMKNVNWIKGFYAFAVYALLQFTLGYVAFMALDFKVNNVFLISYSIGLFLVFAFNVVVYVLIWSKGVKFIRKTVFAAAQEDKHVSSEK